MRSTFDVFLDHLLISAAGPENIEKDVRRNYHIDCVIITNFGTFYGHDGLKGCLAIVQSKLPHSNFDYTFKETSGDIAYVEWNVDNQFFGCETFQIRNGKILVQTISFRN